jgi:hypothetical protein
VGFAELMALEKVRRGDGDGEDVYVSTTPAWSPGNGAAFGGHVFAQAVWAACLDLRGSGGGVEGDKWCHVSVVFLSSMECWYGLGLWAVFS